MLKKFIIERVDKYEKIIKKILGCYRKLKKLMCQIGVAQEELRETNEKLEAQKKKLEKTEDMLREKQGMFADASYNLQLAKEGMIDFYNKQRVESEKLDDIIRRYQVMYSDYKKIYESLERYKRRTLHIDRAKIDVDIPYSEVKLWMEAFYIVNPDTGKKTTVADYCREVLRHKRNECLDDELEVWTGIQNEIGNEMERIAQMVPEVL